MALSLLLTTSMKQETENQNGMNGYNILGTSLWKTLIVRVKDEDGGRGNRNDLFNWAHIIMLNQVCSMLES